MQTSIGLHLAENNTHSLTVNCRGGEWYAVIYQFGGMFLYTSGAADCPSMAMEQLAEDIENDHREHDLMESLHQNGYLRPNS